ncbi:MAG: TonB-dependent receptor [Ignavibacteriae bacterium]|nr:MAG: TonB-dependent receptor [Ignavibacteriota bacterium]
MMISWIIPRILLTASLVILCTYHAIARGVTGTIDGKVTDKHTKEALAGVNVLVTGLNQGMMTDEKGMFKITNVRAGSYTLRISLIGYRTIMMTEVVVLPDLRTTLTIEMEQATVEMEGIEIRAERPLFQKEQASTAFQVNAVKLEQLPIQRFQDVLLLQPGVTREGNVRGGKAQEVAYLIDGIAVQDVLSGGIGSNLPKSAVTGLTMMTGGFEAEYGTSLSGVVNVITKTGTNEHQFGFRYEKDDWLPESLNKQIDHATELEFSLSGPLIQDKLFYFSANNLLASDTRWWQDFWHFFRPSVQSDFSGITKIEFVPVSTLRLSLQGIYSIQDWRDYEFSWRYNLDGLPPRSKRSVRLAALISHTISNSSYYTFSASVFNQQNRIGRGNKADLQPVPYEYDLFLRYIVAGSRNWWADSRQTIYSLKGDFTSQILEGHLFKVGAEFNYYDVFSDLVKYEPQLTYFGKPIANAPMLNYSNSFNYYPQSGSFYIQDKIQLRQDGSILSIGCRWDFLDPKAERPIVEYIPVSQNDYNQQVKEWKKATRKQQVSPRISFAGPIGPSSYVFVNYGQYFQFPLFNQLYSGINPAQIFSGAKNVQAGNPDLEPERLIAWEMGYKYGLREDMYASVTYFQKQTKNQVDSKTLIPFDSKSAGDYGFATYVNTAEATASGLEFVVSRERSGSTSGTLSYTYMVAEGLSEYVDQGINQAQWGFPLVPHPYPLSWDQRHTVKLDANVLLTKDIHANFIAVYSSPKPYTYFPTRDGFTPMDTLAAFLPNNDRMGNVVEIDVKLYRDFRLGTDNPVMLTLYADISNLLNSKNVRWKDSNGRIGGELGDPSAYYESRRVRVGFRCAF